MSREIKFRAWDNLNQRLVQDYFWMDSDGGVWYDLDPHGVDMSGKKKILTTDKLVIMQFTGLKDKNGKDIYEGDIIDYGNGRNRPVEFIDGAFCILQIPSMSKLMTLYSIIGNIYEPSNQSL